MNTRMFTNRRYSRNQLGVRTFLQIPLALILALAITLSGLASIFMTHTAHAAVGDYVWTERQSAGAQNWRSMATSADGTKMVAVAQYGYIYTSADSGATWTQRTSAGSRYWSDVAVSADGTKIAATVGAQWSYDEMLSQETGYIYTSADSGTTWTEHITPGNRQWRSIAMDSTGQKMFAVALAFNQLYKSTDAGDSWSTSVVTGNLSFANSISASSDGAVVAIASGYLRDIDDNGNSLVTATARQLVISHDGGVSFTQQTTLGTALWSSVGVSGNGNTIIALARQGAGGSVWSTYISGDGGLTWDTTAMGNGALLGISLSADGNTMALVQDTMVRLSGDSGVTWQDTDITADLAITISATGNRIAAAASNDHIYTAVPQQPTLSFTPSDSSTSSVPPASTDPQNPQTITNVRPTFSGIAYANGSVTVTVNSDPIICSTTADTNGNWSCTLPSGIPPGTHTVTIVLTNPVTSQTITLGPYYVQVLGDSVDTTIDDGTPLAPNTGVGDVTTVNFVTIGGLILLVVGVALPMVHRRVLRG